jgi:CRISPR-associated protein Cas1
LLYSLLVKDCTIACLACGLDPYVGFLHQPRHGKPALALDLMEEFRPLVADSTALTLLNNRQLDAHSFITAGRSVSLTPTARKTVFTAYERRLAANITHPVFEYRVSYRRAIELQARLLAKTLTGEITEYIPFITR